MMDLCLWSSAPSTLNGTDSKAASVGDLFHSRSSYAKATPSGSFSRTIFPRQSLASAMRFVAEDRLFDELT
jgi:hypothetical protein